MDLALSRRKIKPGEPAMRLLRLAVQGLLDYGLKIGADERGAANTFHDFQTCGESGEWRLPEAYADMYFSDPQLQKFYILTGLVTGAPGASLREAEPCSD